jgi:hypothetical protein
VIVVVNVFQVFSVAVCARPVASTVVIGCTVMTLVVLLMLMIASSSVV